MSFNNILVKLNNRLNKNDRNKINSDFNLEQVNFINSSNKDIENAEDLEKKKNLFFSGNKLGDEFWYEDPSILLNINRITEFFPTDTMTYSEKLNSIFRLSILISLILMIIRKNYLYLYIAILGGFFTYLLDKNKNNEDFEHLNNSNNNIKNDKQKNCNPPTKDNPFMNLLLSDIKYDPNHKACDKTYGVKNDINKYFDHNLYKDVGDVFNNNNSQRQYYTTPSTTLPNDQTSFANWLYKVPTTCKSGDGRSCVQLQSPNKNFSNSLWKYTP